MLDARPMLMVVLLVTPFGGAFADRPVAASESWKGNSLSGSLAEAIAAAGETLAGASLLVRVLELTDGAYLEGDAAAGFSPPDGPISFASLMAVPDVPDELRPLLDAFVAFASVPPGSTAFLDARQNLLRAALALNGVDVLPPIVFALPPVLAIDTIGVDSVYVDDFQLIYDRAGNDKYWNNAGGACSLPAALIDREGDDLYESGRRCGVNGGGNGGPGFLYDAAGDDKYISGGNGANGAGRGRTGHGFLADLSGDDQYLALNDTFIIPGAFATNGGGLGEAARGFLYDGGGNDRYVGAGLGVNGGGAELGRGFLYDLSGDDAYVAQSSGVNGGAQEKGRGFLLDRLGNDVYITLCCSTNGGASDLSEGYLEDVSGDDLYSARCCATNGGAYGARGQLIDRGGNDTYVATGGNVNGRASGGCVVATIDECVFDLAFGFGLLRDEGGRDRYQETDLGPDFHDDLTINPKGDYGAQLDLSSMDSAQGT